VARHDSIERFYREHASSVHAFLVSLCGDRTWAEDLMHDTFTKATLAMGGYRDGNPKAWLFAIARNVFLDDVRRRRPVPMDPVERPASPTSDITEVDAIERTLGIASDLWFIKDGIAWLGRIARNATGDITEDGKHFVPEDQRAKVIRAARIYLAIIAAVILACVAAGSILSAMFVVLPRFYGGCLSQLFNLTQHAGLDEDVYDHRLNTRTVILNPAFSFLYINMNYHIEHHMFPMVPFYRLPELHEMIKDQCSQPCHGLWQAYREILPALLRQQTEPAWYVRRPLPAGAAPRAMPTAFAAAG
jgi:hypothetical protein